MNTSIELACNAWNKCSDRSQLKYLNPNRNRLASTISTHFTRCQFPTFSVSIRKRQLFEEFVNPNTAASESSLRSRNDLETNMSQNSLQHTNRQFESPRSSFRRFSTSIITGFRIESTYERLMARTLPKNESPEINQLAIMNNWLRLGYKAVAR